MKKFFLFIGALIAFLILLANLGPMIVLAVCIWLLYVIFKQFIKADSTASKIAWVLIGLVVISVGIPNTFAIIGIGAAFLLYVIYKKWHEHDEVQTVDEKDPFIHFEEEWQELYK